MLERRKIAIIIDCADFSGKAGDIGVFDAEKLEAEENEILSLHGTDVMGTIKLAKKLGIDIEARIRIIGIQPQNLEMGTEPSPPVLDAIEKIPSIVRKILKLEANE